MLENKKNTLVIILFFYTLLNFSQNGSPVCETAEPMCSDNKGVKIFNNVTGVTSAGTIGCLFDTPNPAWFFIKVGSTGKLNFQIIQNSDFDSSGNPTGAPLDVDFVSWGPFNTPNSNCTNLSYQCLNDDGSPGFCLSNTEDVNFYPNDLDNSNIIDCSFDGLSQETFSINNAIAGEFYILLITNYDGNPGKIKLEQTNFGQPGAGTTDCSIISGELGPNQTVCNGTEITLDGTPTTGTATGYEWLVDTGSGYNTIVGETSATLKITTNLSGTYQVIITDDKGNKTTDDVVISFLPVPIANPVSNINFCDSDGDGFNTFDFQADTTPTVLGLQDPAQFEVLYFNNITDAQNNNTANALTNPYTNTTPFTNEDIYVRIHNTTDPGICFAVTQFKLSVTNLPKPNQASDYIECENDLIGFFNNYILASKDAEILGSLPISQYKVTYHTTLTGAQTDSFTDLIDKNIPYKNTTINEQTIYIRVENVDNINCSVISTPTSTTFKPFKLVVNPLPIIVNNPAEIKQCDINGDLTTTINLTQAQISISNNHLNETFKYYVSEADANSDSREIVNPINHITSNGDVIWVRTISSKNCFKVSKLNIIVSFTPNIIYNKEFITCDDFLDINGNNTVSNNDKDGVSNFNLSKAITEIKELFPIPLRNNLEVLLFETINDRDAVVNQINDVTNYRNINIPAFPSQSIYIKIINKINNDCTGLGEFSIKVNPLPDFDITSPQITCLNAPSFIEAEAPDGNYNYEWRKNGNLNIIGTNQQLNITNGGIYEVTAINTVTNCGRSKTIVINESIIATINQNDVTIVDDSENNSISINNNGNNLGIGDYEFALQNEDKRLVHSFQDEPFFENLQGGIYTILVRDKNNCGVAQLDVSVLEFPKFFTPNADGINDLWNVKGASTSFYPQSSMYIFDRYGKTITSLQINGEGWNGLYNGKMLPSNDYWFKITLTDLNGNIINRQGNFSLLRK